MDDYTSGTFNKSYGYGDNDDSSVEEHSEYEGEFPLDPKTDKPRVLILGLRRAGKSSIQKVVFSKMSPNETLFLESSNKMSKDEVSTSSFVSFSIWNFSGQMDFFDNHVHDEIFNGFIGALVFVIDAQEDYTEALTKLYHTVIRVHKINPSILFEIFIHKVDCVSEENRLEIQRDIYQRLTDDLQDGSYDSIKFNYHLTSIYDHSIFEAFSKVVQKLIPQLHELEQTLNMFISNSRIEKAFLFDVLSKIYIATDGSPVDVQTYELCCDMIDVVIDISGIYGVKEDGDPNMFDGNSTSIIKLNNQTVLYLREVNSYLALVCILREESFERQGLIDYNFNCFKQAIQELFKDKNETQIKLNGTHSVLNESPIPTIDSD